MKTEAKSKITVATYDKDPQYFAEKFKGIGARTKDIDLAFEYNTSKSNAVLELGCGDGRDAAYIIQKTKEYIGIDASTGLINIAKGKLGDVDFKCLNMKNVNFPPNSFGIIFAFASLLHVNREELVEIFKKAHIWLKKGGVFYISLKYSPEYKEMVDEEEVGVRYFYYYSPEEVVKAAGDGFSVVFHKIVQKGKTKWLEIVIKK